jgi:hypothetical protein
MKMILCDICGGNVEHPDIVQFEMRSKRGPGVILVIPTRDLCHTCKTDLKHFMDLSLDSFIVRLTEFYKTKLEENTDEDISEGIKTLKGLGYL